MSILLKKIVFFKKLNLLLRTSVISWNISEDIWRSTEKHMGKNFESLYIDKILYDL